MSPTPTAGLSGGDRVPAGFSGFGDPSSAYSLPPSVPLSMRTSQQREGRERIRSVWDSFRERLGLNRNSSTVHSGDDAPSGTDEQGNMRPGELMLAEMARALNIGLGLNGDGSVVAGHSGQNTDSTSPNPTEAQPSDDGSASRRPSPTEDSFERFLLNLQADLRTALSGDIADSTASPDEDDPQPAEGSLDDDDRHSSDSVLAELPLHVGSEDDELPRLEDGSDSDGDDGTEYVEEHSSTRTPTPMPATTRFSPNRQDQAPSGNPPDEHSPTDRRPPGINLWRLYRFQPIPASQVANHAVTTTSTPVNPSPPAPSSLPPSTTTTPSPHPLSAGPQPPPVTAASGDAVPIPAAAPATLDGGTNMVVPVIVVGLQSVDMGQVHGHVHHENDATPPDHWEPNRRSASFDDAESAAEDSGGPTPRGRSWQSRAATALRNLRPGRRNGSRGRQSADGSGSRTFLIYVIGGECYPY